ncbi:MAG TPA: hypothetical protein VK524_01780, partial [Polyangiaceae bacterium]|nr:hypothetical protein [Polyangiaceae bacterium]
GLSVSTTLGRATDGDYGPSTASEDTVARTVQSRLLECVGEIERARYAMEVLLEHTGAECGHLYAVRGGRLTRLCSQPAAQAVDGLAETLELCMSRAICAGDETTVSLEAVVPLSWTDSEGRCFEPMLVSNADQAGIRVAAVAALSYGPRRLPMPNAAVLGALATALLAHDDVDLVNFVS